MNMQSILRWSIEHSDPQGAPSGSDGSGQPSRPIDPEIIDAILGKPDSELMKEALAVATDEMKDEDAKLTALDDFEMLIEQIDNANNIEKMGMWPTIQNLLTSPTSTDNMRAAVLWIIGTAAQNNPAAQSAYISLPGSPLSSILSYLSPTESSSATRSKAVYALSGLLKHNAMAVGLLNENGGWQVLKDALEDPDITVRRKVVFLLNALLLPTTTTTSVTSTPSARVLGGGLTDPSAESEAQPTHPNSHASLTIESAATAPITKQALRDHGFIPCLVQGLVNPVPHGRDGDQEGDEDLEEKLIRLLYTYFTSSDGASATGKADKAGLKSWLEKRTKEGEQWDLGKEELRALQTSLV